MTVYSHSRLSMFQQCPLRYKLNYLDRIKRPAEESVEAFLGSRIHETLQKCYEDIRLNKKNSLNDLLAFYNRIWEEKWQDSIIIVKKDFTPEHYRTTGEKQLENYYNRYSPFDTDITIGTEMRLNFSLDNDSAYKMVGYIDRLSLTHGDVYEVHDYKTSAHLPDQKQVDTDRQLSLYHLAVKQKWPSAGDIKLVWHYLAFDTEMVSHRSAENISTLSQEIKRMIEQIETAQDFPPTESPLCNWCEYQDLCPLRKHFYQLKMLSENEYLYEPGLILVDKFAELKKKAEALDEDIAKVKEAIIEYARKGQIEIIKGKDNQVRVKFNKKLKFPGKNEKTHRDLDDTIIQAGKWMEVSQIDTSSLIHIIETNQWSEELIEQVMKNSIFEETVSTSLSKLKD